VTPVAPPPAEAIARAAQALRRGEVVCLPTETTYGLAVDIRVRGALDALLKLKRDRNTPLALIAADLAQARGLARVWPARAEQLASDYWPGPLTLIVPARADLPAQVVGPSGGVGVRVSAHPWARALAAAVGAPVTATSANPSGESPAVSVDEARRYFGDEVEVYLDAGPASARSVSTLVDVAEDGTTRLLRPGLLTVPGL
jgi:L-threonylcarbamoyladenylate synthase